METKRIISVVLYTIVFNIFFLLPHLNVGIAGLKIVAIILIISVLLFLSLIAIVSFKDNMFEEIKQDHIKNHIKKDKVYYLKKIMVSVHNLLKGIIFIGSFIVSMLYVMYYFGIGIGCATKIRLWRPLENFISIYLGLFYSILLWLVIAIFKKIIVKLLKNEIIAKIIIMAITIFISYWLIKTDQLERWCILIMLGSVPINGYYFWELLDVLKIKYLFTEVFKEIKYVNR